ncbi:uncharacterized protein LOC126901046 [Daktulosphaira vitifoliae]|uniref:uncharacterized protein LOC126901046 n=1 Tax=Daktulosphaira vitifoliae TaxID=58002 RepID=UPI0021A9A50F|nr:uncharacterized protein LOC126901046 [Daktulosphaira vitifoliae]
MNYLSIVYSLYYFSLLDDIKGAERTVNRPNLPVGKYKLKFNAASICNESIDYPINFNLKLSKTSPTKTLLIGNITMSISFDDILIFNMNMAVWSKIGGWKDNAYVYRNKNACSTLKYFLGNVWNTFVKNFKNKDCPFLQGHYPINGFDLSLVEQANFPKEFFYGKYKLKVFYTDDKIAMTGRRTTNDKNNNTCVSKVIIDQSNSWLNHILLNNVVSYECCHMKIKLFH